MNALVLSGGGARGSGVLGVLAFVAVYLRDRYPGWFRFISGTSVGAIISAGIAMFDAHRFPAAVSHTWRLWSQIKKSRDVYRWKWWMIPLLPIMILIEFLFVPWMRKRGWIRKQHWGWYRRTFHSFAHTKPLEKFLRRVVNVEDLRKSNVEVRWAAVDMGTRKRSDALIYFDKYFRDPVLAILASAAFPVVFPLVLIGKHLFTDGGVRDIAPLQPAIDAGAKQILAVLSRNPDPPSTGEEDDETTLEWPRWFLPNSTATIDQMSDEVLWNDVSRCRSINEAVKLGENTRHKHIQLDVIVPVEPFHGSLDFSWEKAKENFRIGWKSAELYYKSIGVLPKNFKAECPV